MSDDTPSLPPRSPEPPQSVVLHNVSWDLYERLIEVAGDSHTRITYFRGDMEILYPSDPTVREAIDRLIGDLRTAPSAAATG